MHESRNPMRRLPYWQRKLLLARANKRKRMLAEMEKRRKEEKIAAERTAARLFGGGGRDGVVDRGVVGLGDILRGGNPDKLGM